jgi:hypothetical protein
VIGGNDPSSELNPVSLHLMLERSHSLVRTTVSGRQVHCSRCKSGVFFNPRDYGIEQLKDNMHAGRNLAQKARNSTQDISSTKAYVA